MDTSKIDFGKGKIGRLFRLMFFPTLIAMIFNSAFTIVDGIFVGQGVGADGLASVNIVAPLFTVCTGVGLMFGIGSSVVASIRLSESNLPAARRIMTEAFAAGSALMGLICLGCLLFPKGTVTLMGGSSQLEADSVAYLLWLLPAMFFIYVESIGMMLIRLDGSPKYSMAVQVVAAVLNIILDWVFIFPLGWGVAGAAAATSISCAVGGAMVFIYFIWMSDKLRFCRLKMTAQSAVASLFSLWHMAKIGFATFLTELAMSVMMLTGNYMFMARLGEAGVAAFSVACYLFPVVFSINNAVAQSAQPIISYNYGLKDFARVRQTLRYALVTALICGAAITAGLYFGGDTIVGLFLHSGEAAYPIALKGLPLFATCAIFFALNVAFIGYYQSIEKAGQSTFYTLLRGVLLIVPAFIFLPRVIGDTGLWLAIPAAETVTLIVIVMAFVAQHKSILKKA